MLTFKRRTPEKSSRTTMDKPPRKAKSRRRRNPELSDSEIFEKAKQAALDLYTELETNDRWFEDDPMPGETIQVGNQKVDYVEEKVVVQTSKGPKTQTVRRPLGWKELFAREAIMKPFVGEVLKEVYQTAGDPPEVFMGFVNEDPAVVSYKNDITINAFRPIKNLPAADFPPDQQILDLALQQAEGAYNRFIQDVRSRYPRPEDIIIEEEVDEIYEDIDPEVRKRLIEEGRRFEARMSGEVYESLEEEAEFMRMVEEEAEIERRRADALEKIGKKAFASTSREGKEIFKNEEDARAWFARFEPGGLFAGQTPRWPTRKELKEFLSERRLSGASARLRKFEQELDEEIAELTARRKPTYRDPEEQENLLAAAAAAGQFWSETQYNLDPVDRFKVYVSNAVDAGLSSSAGVQSAIEQLFLDGLDKNERDRRRELEFEAVRRLHDVYDLDFVKNTPGAWSLDRVISAIENAMSEVGDRKNLDQKISEATQSLGWSVNVARRKGYDEVMDALFEAQKIVYPYEYDEQMRREGEEIREVGEFLGKAIQEGALSKDGGDWLEEARKWEGPEPITNPKKKRRRKNADDGAGQALGITVLIIAKIAEGELDIRGFTLEDLGLNPGFRSGAKHLIDEGFINEVGRTTDGEVYYSLTPSAKKQLIEDGVMFESYGQSAEPTGRRAKLTVVPDFENNPKSNKGKKKAAKKTAKKATKKATTAEPKKRGRPKKATAAPAAPAAPKKRGRPKKATAAPAAPAAPKKRGRPKKATAAPAAPAAPKKRGRPKKATAAPAAPKKRGRPKKNP
jgi:hypothetical protein